MLNELVDNPDDLISSFKKMKKKFDDYTLLYYELSNIYGKDNTIKDYIQKMKESFNENENNHAIYEAFGASDVDSIIHKHKQEEEFLKEIGKLLGYESSQMAKNKVIENLKSTEKLLKETNCLSIDDITATISELMKMTKSQTPKMIKNLLTQVLDENNELNNKIHVKKEEILDKNEEITQLKSLLNSEKGNVKLKFDEFEDKINNLKNELRKSQSANQELTTEREEIEYKRKMLEKNNENFEKQIEIALNENKRLKSLIEQTNEEKRELVKKFEKSKQDNQQNIETINNLKNKESTLQNQYLEAQKYELYKQKTEYLANLLNIENDSQIEPHIQQLLTENQNSKQIESDLKMKIDEYQNEIQSIRRILNIDNETSISESIHDLIETKKEASTDNQDLVQKLGAVADFLNIPNAKTASLVNIQKAIRSLQKQTENLQQENETLHTDNDKMVKRVEEAENNEKMIRKVFKVDNFDQSQSNKMNSLIDSIAENENIIQKACKNLEINKKDLLETIVNDQNIISTLCTEFGTNKTDLVKKAIFNQQIVDNLCDEFNVDKSKIFQNVINDKKTIIELCKELKTDKSELLTSAVANKRIVDDLCNDFNIKKEELVEKIQSQKSSIVKAADILNTSGSQITDAIEESNRFISTVCKTLKCEKENAIDNIEENYQTLNKLMKISKKDNTEQLLEEYGRLINENKKFNEVKNSLNVKSTDEIDGVISEMKEKIHESQTNQKELFKILNIDENIQIGNLKNGLNHIESIKSSIKQLQTDKKNENEMMQEIKRLTNSENPVEAIHSIVSSQKSAVKSLKKIFPNITNSDEIPDMITELEKINTQFKQIQKITSSENPIEEIQSMKDEMKNLQNILKLGNNESVIETIKNKLDYEKEIQRILGTNDSPIEKIKEVFKQNDEISRVIGISKSSNNIDSNNISSITDSVKEMNSLKNNLSNLLKTKDTEEIYEKIQRQNQLNNSLISILKTNNSDEIIDKVNELTGIEKIIKKQMENNFNETENKFENEDMKDYVTRIHRENKDLNNFFEKISQKVESQDSYDILRKIDKLQSKSNKLCRILDCSEESIEHHISRMKDNMNNIANVFSDDEEVVQNAKKSKNLIDKIAEMVSANDKNDIIPKIHELQEKTKDQEKFKSKMNEIFNNNSNIENAAFSYKNQSDKLCSLMNCDFNDAYDVIRRVLNTFNVSSFVEVANVAKTMKETIDRLSKKMNDDKTFVSEFLSDGDINNLNEEEIINTAFNKLKNQNKSLLEALRAYKNEVQRHSKAILLISKGDIQANNNSLDKSLNNNESLAEMNTTIFNNLMNKNERSIEEYHKIFEEHEVQLKFLRETLHIPPSASFSAVFDTISSNLEKSQELNKATEELNRCKSVLYQKNCEISEIMKCCKANSPQFVVNIIEDMKMQIHDLENENSENRTGKTISESLKMFEMKEKAIFVQVAQKLNEISEMLFKLLSIAEAGKMQKVELVKLLESALCESMQLRKTLETQGPKLALFGPPKNKSQTHSISDDIRARERDISQRRKRAEKAEATFNRSSKTLL
ncbi:hypothetical protein TRFO_32673 [Tritrichomonas foetus]|uniref:Uncharacterized protein n=1 Tax=Tritrichomonas foetus TaxID=1144522 RepID=A0A1J4JQC7_9EUKA|nr:hypothetical protein TRFO_32673 [Tritrichomonas foetus]|eukprot:OHT00616.1 hypothetical protein TRFO_32673 [Tritrichomonas foetus]